MVGWIFIFHIVSFFALSAYHVVCCRGDDKDKAQGKKLRESNSEGSKPKSGAKSISEKSQKHYDNSKLPEANLPFNRSDSDPVAPPEKPKVGKIVVREMSQESQMSKSIMMSVGDTSGDIPTDLDEIDDPFDSKKMPLPPKPTERTPVATTPNDPVPAQ